MKEHSGMAFQLSRLPLSQRTSGIIISDTIYPESEGIGHFGPGVGHRPGGYLISGEMSHPLIGLMGTQMTAECPVSQPSRAL